MFAVLSVLAASYDHTDAFTNQYNEIYVVPQQKWEAKKGYKVATTPENPNVLVEVSSKDIEINLPYFSVVTVNGDKNKITVTGPGIVQVNGNNNVIKNLFDLTAPLTHPLILINGTSNEAKATYKGKSFTHQPILAYVLTPTTDKTKLPDENWKGDRDYWVHAKGPDSPSLRNADVCNYFNISTLSFVQMMNNTLSYVIPYENESIGKYTDPITVGVAIMVSVIVICILIVICVIGVVCVYPKILYRKASFPDIGNR